MILKEEIRKIESSANFEELSYEIGDVAFILEILRDKLYSNAPKAICQEIMSNARDAHRELGNTGVPIRVTLPTTFDPNYRVRDFGIGITPERMEEVFVKYGVSTKRGSNNYTGSWGIGSKVPYSYGDSYQVITINPENGKNIRREYISYLDESRKGKLVLTKTEETVEERGTEIVVPVKEDDFYKFSQYTQISGKWWDVQPVVKGTTEGWEWELPEITLTGKDKDWAIINEKYSSNKIILDGIEYEINLQPLISLLSSDNYDFIYKSSSSFDFVLYFNTGDLYMNASRDSIDYDEKSAEKIYNIIKKMVDEASADIVEKIGNAKTRHEAVCLYEDNETFGVQKENIVWGGLPLPVSTYRKAYEYGETQKTVSFYSIEKKTDTGRYSSRMLSSVNIKSNSRIIYTTGGTSKPQVGRIYTFFEKNQDVENLYVVKKGVIPTFDKLFSNETDVLEDNYDKHIFKNTRTLTSTGTTTKTGNAYILERTRSHDLEKVKIDFKNGSGIYVQKLRSDVSIFGSWHKSNYFINRMTTILGGKKKIYGILEKDIKKLGSHWINVESLILKVADKVNSDTGIKKYGIGESDSNPAVSSEIYKRVDKKSYYSKKYEEYKNTNTNAKRAIIARAEALIYIGVKVNTGSKNGSITEDIEKRYPLLGRINYYGLSSDQEYSHAALYVSAVDEKLKKSA